MENIHGTIVGYRLPAYVKGINVPGCHLRFVCEDQARLGFTLTSGIVQLSELSCFRLILPENFKDFDQLDLTQDRSHELNAVESAN